MSLTASSSLECEQKIFHELDVHHVYKVGITCFWSQDAKMSLTASSSLECEQKILHELDVHHFYKVGISCFWAQDAKMSLTAISSLESARRKFSWTRRTSYLQSSNHYFLGYGCQNESNSQYPERIGEKKIFHELDVHHVYKVGITCFWAQDTKMSLTAISSLESARRKFSWTPGTSCLQSRNQLFLGSGCQNEYNSHQIARIGEKEIFHELDVHHVYKVGISCFWAQDAKMSLTAISSLESARRKFFMNSTYIMSTKYESLDFALRMPKWV